MADKESRAEREYRYGQQTMKLGLLVVVATAGAGLATAFRPDSVLAHVLGIVVPMATATAVMGISALLRRGLGKGAGAARVSVPLDDEWTRMHMARAQRVALVAVVLAQMPIGILMARLPTTRALLGMGVLTITLALGTFFGCYLYFTREGGDG